VNGTECRLFGELLAALAERFSKTGHVLQQIEWENRGHCPPAECCLRCTTYAALMIEASELLEADMAQPTQAALFEEVAG
jgi:sugar diacid utilization regulator